MSPKRLEVWHFAQCIEVSCGLIAFRRPSFANIRAGTPLYRYGSTS
jgi:hypothetical protein